MVEKIRLESSSYFTKELIFLSSTFNSCTMILGKLNTWRSWYHGRQPEVFLPHDSHCACQDVLELRSRTSKREFSSWNQRFKFWVLRRVFVIEKEKFFVWNHVFFIWKKQTLAQIFERHFRLNYSVGVRDGFTLYCRYDFRGGAKAIRHSVNIVLVSYLQGFVFITP